MNRIKFLDGLRGIAILLVVLYHAYTRWGVILPYKNKFSEIFVFKYGYLGVELFFLISGFVILMSLEKCSSFPQFIYKRWVRLFPGMLVATIIIFFSASFFIERPLGIPKSESIISGLLFVEPSWINLLFGTHLSSLEGSFWSLFVEFKFYVLFGLAYFLYKKERSIFVLLFIFIFSMVVNTVRIPYLTSISSLFSFEYFGWFLSGSLSYLYFKNNEIKYVFFSTLTGVAQILYYNVGSYIFSFILLFIFILPICLSIIRPFYSNKFLIFFGFISYPFYLLHENMMIALILKVDKLNLSIHDILLPIVPITTICFLSFLVAKFFEPSLRKRINNIQTIILKF